MIWYVALEIMASQTISSQPIIGYFSCIPYALRTRKIGRVDDAEIVGNRIAEDGPVFRHLHAQEMQNQDEDTTRATQTH
jgi:hypothetical protein